MFIFNTVAMDIKAFSAVSNFNQQHLVNNFTFQTFTKGEASDGKADKCSASDHYHHNHRRRCITSQGTTSDKPCMQR